MGNVAKRPDGKWRARWRDPSGKEHAKHFDRKVDASRWLNTVEIAPGERTRTDPKTRSSKRTLPLKGESVIAVAERLGHKNANLVLSTYGHLMPDSEERTRKAIDDAWKSPSADQGRTGTDNTPSDPRSEGV